MSDLNHTTRFYRQRFRQKETQYNVPSQLPSYFDRFIGDKKKVLIGEMGAGPINTIGNLWPTAEIEIYACDWFQPEYQKFWKDNGKTPVVPVKYENMEALSLPDETFDIVHCVNALDHTVNADIALKELIRVCKKGGWVYLRHHLNQRSLHAREHRWDAKENGDFIGRHMTFNVKDFAPFNTTMEDNQVISTWQKI